MSIKSWAAFFRANNTNHPGYAAIGSGIVLGIIASIFSVALLTAASHLVPMAAWGKSAAGELPQQRPIALFFFAVIVMPAFETLQGQVLPIELARYLGARNATCIALGAAAFGLGHFYNGGMLHSVTALCAGAVFSFGYVVNRAAGIGPAMIVSAGAHAMHNATLLFVVAPLFPQLA